MKASGWRSSITSMGWLLYQPYKWLFVYPFFILNSILFGTVAIGISLLFGHKTGSKICGVNWARLNTIITPARVRVTGRKHLKKGQSYVIVSNHRSAYDILAIYGWLGVDFKWVMKKEVRKIPGVGFGSAAIGHIFIDRSNTKNAIASINAARQKLKGGTSVFFFPEGTRSQTGALLPFKKGAFKFAVDLGLPVLPIAITGTERILPNGTLDLVPGKARIMILPPIETIPDQDRALSPLLEASKESIENALQQSAD